jgi:hypothetical protein
MARINWGLVEKLAPQVQRETVCAWLDAHEPSEPGYQGASRWLARRERAARTVARLRPRLEKLAAEHRALLDARRSA